ERYISNRLSELSLPALRQKLTEAGVLDDRELMALYSKFTSKMQNQIRDKLDDGFKSHFDAAIKKVEDAGSESETIVSKFRELETFQRKSLCTKALAILCGMKHANDLTLVRKTIDEFEVDCTESVLRFFARFGDWSDIERIKGLGEYPFDRTSMVGVDTTRLQQQKASAILVLGKNRTADMLALDLDDAVRKSLAKLLTKKAIANLSDEILMRELNRKDDGYRAIFALRCAQSLSKARILALLNLYISSEHYRYYNSVHWLDLGSSMPHRLVNMIVQRKLSYL
ncbi:MAG: hypothetical protein AAF197_12040, partial [Pseudomonadota bacterium]